ncbi:MAG: hypothetical protein LQ350_001693 [Teloschistes chrysophthalmus]|nr:MAG: hypothetical protein LQ350_001693 [Niorma chrysophthalma]
MFEIYDAAAAHGSMIVGGQDPDVGLVGHLTGGGHAPISGTYGLAADNVLELEVVTPAGDIKTVNQCTNSDLFFAFRGGGGSTFGVVLSATIKTHPMPSMTWSHFDIVQTSSTREPFWQAMAYYHSQLPHLVKSGLMGYYNISSISPFEPSTSLILGAGVWILNTSVPSFNAIVDPVLNHIQATYPVTVTRSARYEPSFYDWWKVYSPAGAVATESQLGNRLVDEKALSQPLDKIASSLAAAYQNLVMISNLVSGPGMWNAQPPGGIGSMTPAWRKTIVEIIVPVIWPAHNASARAQQTHRLTNGYMDALRRWAPGTGTYLNEADANEPDLAGEYWGRGNYERLVGVKREWDPEGVFWCGPCVLGGEWEVREDDGRLCKV